MENRTREVDQSPSVPPIVPVHDPPNVPFLACVLLPQYIFDTLYSLYSVGALNQHIRTTTLM